jgi:FixJ family two-component response regulator
VAHKLGISEKTVEKHLMKGMQLLAEAVLSQPDTMTKEEDERGRVPRSPERGKP